MTVKHGTRIYKYIFNDVYNKTRECSKTTIRYFYLFLHDKRNEKFLFLKISYAQAFLFFFFVSRRDQAHVIASMRNRNR